jgi:hypothetical protein
VVLAIVVVNQSIMGRPPLQYKLSTRPSHFRPNLRQSRGKRNVSLRNIQVIADALDTSISDLTKGL